MEVHHSHQSGHKKKWTGYLLEFFMLFLAVFLGFTAENIREHAVERKRGKIYIRSLYEDVKKDTANLSATISYFERALPNLDSLLLHFDLIKGQHYPVLFMKKLPFLTYTLDFVYTDRTMQQLKNAGGLRLIEDKATADSIVNYDAAIRLQMIQLEAIEREKGNLYNLLGQVFNNQLIDQLSVGFGKDSLVGQNGDWILTHDKTILGNYYNHIRMYKQMCFPYLDLLKESRNTGSRLLAFLKREYHLK